MSVFFSSTSQQNVALNKLTTQSSTPGGGYARYVADGNRTTYSHTECTGDQWWEVDLGMMYDINRINVVHRQTGSDYTLRRLRNYYIRFYDAAPERNQVYEIWQGDHVQEKAWDINVSARIVRLFMPAKTSNCLHLAEFEVFGIEVSNSFACRIFSILDTLDFSVNQTCDILSLYVDPTRQTKVRMMWHSQDNQLASL